MQQTARGFTLIEVMIVVVIIGILAAIAYPSYQQYVLRGNRTEGMALLNDAAARQERYFAQNRAYITSNDDLEKLRLPNNGGEDNQVLSATQKYLLEVEDGDGGYELSATPQGAQARDDCGTLTLTATGERGADASTAECWR